MKLTFEDIFQRLILTKSRFSDRNSIVIWTCNTMHIISKLRIQYFFNIFLKWLITPYICTYFGKLNLSTRFYFRIFIYIYVHINFLKSISIGTWTRFSLKVTFLQFCVSQLCSIVYFLLNKTFWFGQNTVFSKSRNVFLENVQWFWLFSMNKVSYEWIF